jgi:PAS domain S-box-containing protein
VDPTEPTGAVVRGLLAAAPDALLAVDPEGLIVYVNDQVEQLFGWSRHELLGRPVECLVPQRFVAKHPDLRAGYVRTATPRPMGAGLELWALRKDGSEFPAEISLSSFETESGKLMAAAIRDVTLARRTEQKFKAVLASAPDAIIGVNADGDIELVNAQAERLFGWSPEQLVGRPIEVLVPAAALENHRAYRNGYLADPQVRPMGAGLALSGRRRDGTEFPAEISLSAVADTDGTLVLAAVRDITDRIALENERRELSLEAQREQSHRLESLGQLAGGVAHDFNNLLGVILNYVTLISRSVDEPLVRSDLGEIRAAAERGAALTKQLLTFARRDVVNAEPVELTEVVDGVVAMLSRTLGDHVTLQLVMADPPLVVVADRHQLEQILLNLAINARDAMPEGGSLTIVAERAAGKDPSGPDDVILRVADTGLGMAPEVVGRAFEPFFTTKDRTKGSGLGLATVYGIVRRSGGDVSLDSEVGVGTTVTIRLPGSAESVPTTSSAPVRHEGGNERILFVEDEEPLRVGTARLLKEYGYDVLVAADGLEALQVFAQEADTIDLVLTDVAMPRMRGDVFAARLATLHAKVPLVFMSGYDSGETPLTGRLLAKPVQEDELLRTIREVLDG